MEKVNLGEYVRIKTGKLDANASNINGKYPFFTCSNDPLRINDYSYDCECVLVAGNGDLNAKYYNGKFDAYQRTYIIESKDKNILNTKYLYYLIDANIEQLRRNAIGGVIKYIKLGNLTNIKFDLVEIKKQNYIIEELDKVQEIIDLRKKQIEELDNLIKSKFVDMFGDIENPKFKCKKLKEIAKVGSSHRVFTTEFVEKGIPFYRGTEISQLANGIEPQNTYYISKEHYLKICDEDTKPKIGDLLMPSICDKGQIWLVDNEKEFYYKDGRVLSISPNSDKINNNYLHAYMKLKTIVEYPKMGSGSTFAEFKIFLLKDLDVIVPPIELQNRFAEIVKVIDKQKFMIKKSLKETEELQASFMNKYFL